MRRSLKDATANFILADGPYAHIYIVFMFKQRKKYQNWNSAYRLQRHIHADVHKHIFIYSISYAGYKHIHDVYNHSTNATLLLIFVRLSWHWGVGQNLAGNVERKRIMRKHDAFTSILAQYVVVNRINVPTWIKQIKHASFLLRQEHRAKQVGLHEAVGRLDCPWTFSSATMRECCEWLHNNSCIGTVRRQHENIASSIKFFCH